MRPRIYSHEQLHSPTEGAHPWQDSLGDTDALDCATLFELLFTMAPPPAVVPRSPEPVERTWLPTPDRAPLPGAAVTRRHPLFTWDFLDAPTMKIGRSPRSNRFGFQNRFPSLKSMRVMRGAANNEFDAFLDSELDPDVEAFLEQPIWLRYQLDGQPKRHKLDLFRLCRPIPEFWEVKYEKHAALPENERRWPAIGQALNGLGYGYRVVTERHLRRAPRWQTITGIYRDRHAPRPARATMDGVKALFKRAETLSVGDILACFPELEQRHVHHLLRHLFLVPVSLDVSLDMQFRVRLGPGYRAWDRNALPPEAYE